MHRRIKILGYSENNNTVAFEVIKHNKKKNQYLGFGIHNFVSGITQIAPNAIIPNYEEEIIKTLSTNDFHLNVCFIYGNIYRNRLRDKYRLCKF